MKRIKSLKEPPVSKQPVKCKGCIWGVWEEAAQFCAKPLGCIKVGGANK